MPAPPVRVVDGRQNPRYGKCLSQVCNNSRWNRPVGHAPDRGRKGRLRPVLHLESSKEIPQPLVVELAKVFVGGLAKEGAQLMIA